MKLLEIPITIEIDCHDIGDPQAIAVQLRQAVTAAAQFCGYTVGTIGVLITDDETIHEINREQLDHDFPTDVISFAYGKQGQQVEGELVASLETARREAVELGWTTINELLLYTVHGTLHICGLGDQDETSRMQMRRAEQQVLLSLGILDAAAFDPDTHSQANYR